MSDLLPQPAQDTKSAVGVEKLAHVLDTLFRVPGTSWRFGLDALIGLVPGVGDALTAVASYTLLFAALRYRVPKIVILRMALNLGIDYVVGSVPVLGDLFDFAWKANVRNVELLQRHRGAATRARTGDYLFVLGIVLGLIALLITCIGVAVWILSQLLTPIFDPIE